MSKENQANDTALLSDEQIIDLYWVRNESAITETDRKYKRYLYSIAYNILHDELDCEECLNDTYLGTWNSIPPTRPSIFQIFLSKIMRNTAVVRYKYNTASKRVPSEFKTSLDELNGCIPYTESAEEAYLLEELSRVISDFLRSLPERRAFIFVCRYYCSDSISNIAQMLHTSESTVFRELTAIRNSLKELLIKEGYDYVK
ncbi:MAG: sigma-70 family RNA polymerase sigma factor [Ruminococcaceae bacterium]|nr:sigma-70 family RNA polymerase sigma factor [Oscillospiraceae bacterium]